MNTRKSVPAGKEFLASEMPHAFSVSHVNLYANSTGFASSFYDLDMVFGRMKMTTDGPIIEDGASITMSWSHAKALSIALAKAIQNHESINGEIRLPNESK